MDYYRLKVLNHKKLFIIIFAVLLAFGSGVIYYFNYFKDEEIQEYNIDEVEEDKSEDNVVSENIYVDIKGFVEKPGVYSFSKDSNARINDLILKAGGLKKNADTSTINLSKKIEDEMTVIIYSKSEIENYVKKKNELETKLEMCELKLVNNACLKEEVKDNKKININTASLDELTKLNGIGESKAKSIIEYRKKMPFSKVDDLKNVEGIGESLYESIKNEITV